MKLQGKVAIVTGGAIRIGRAITLMLAQSGCNVLLHYGRSAEAAQQTAEEARAYGVQVVLFSADLQDDTTPQTIIDYAIETFGRMDILINNAAIFPEEDSFEYTDAALWDQLFAINAKAPYLLSQAFAKQLPDGQEARIINVNDGRVFRTGTDHFVYRFTKKTLDEMTKMLALTLAPHVTVNSVALGAILPPPHLKTLSDEKIAQIPLKRVGNAELVAENVRHLLTQPFLTGVTVPLDGGEFL